MLLEIKKIAVVGAGLMGSGIAQVVATAGFSVSVFDSYEEALPKAKDMITQSLERFVKAGRIKSDDLQKIMGRIEFSKDMKKALDDKDIVIEAVPEIPELKSDVFKKIEDLSRKDTIFASNTSNIRISEIGKSLKDPSRLVGMHFFNPAQIMKLVEVIRGEKTSDEVFETVFNFSKSIGKIPVKVLKDSAGFIVNRISAPESLFFAVLLDHKVDKPEAIDAFAKSQGLPMGPYELMDYVGVDTVYHSLEYYSKTLSPDYGKEKTIKEMVEKNQLGRKTGKGFYQWKDGKAIIPKSEPSSKVDLMDILSLEINEAVKLIEEGVASPDDIEVAFVNGMNRPFGPISAAKGLSNSEVKSKLEKIHEKYGLSVFEPAKSIKEGKLKEMINKKLDQSDSKDKKSAMEVQGEHPSFNGQFIGISYNEHVAIMEIENGRHNLLNNKVLEELDRALDLLREDRESYVIIIRGKNGEFSAGAELTQFIPDHLAFIEQSRMGERIFKKITEMPQIVIAEMSKYVLGGGFEFSLNCDIRISHRECVIGFPEVTIGLLPGWSGSQRLSRLIGLSMASYLVLTGERITGEAAHELGIVQKIFEQDKLREDTFNFARDLSQKVSPVSISLTKRLLNKGFDISYDAGLEMESIAMGSIYASKDFMEGISAFVQKRKPEFRNR
ncbi:3-hydroxyacyl-CoA dehydrogenase NAD-binding domain-containing protein [Caldiplasma sukawensis]